MGERLLLVGCGNMGYAMLKGWIAAGRLAPADVIVIEPADALRARAAELGVAALSTDSMIDAAFVPQVVLFAVKPQVMAAVVPAYARFVAPSVTFVSVAAGTPVAFFDGVLGAEARIVRCMPNTPAAIGAGMLVTYAKANVSREALERVTGLLAVSGRTAEVSDESLMDAVTAVSGSGPAYVFHFIECLTGAGIAAGLPEETAKLLAMQTVYGAARLAAESGEDPARLREQVTSPKGTTAAALSVLMGDDRMKRLLGEAVEAARARSVELGR